MGVKLREPQGEIGGAAGGGGGEGDVWLGQMGPGGRGGGRLADNRNQRAGTDGAECAGAARRSGQLQLEGSFWAQICLPRG